jgi:hypothetical protein
MRMSGILSRRVVVVSTLGLALTGAAGSATAQNGRGQQGGTGGGGGGGTGGGGGKGVARTRSMTKSTNVERS